MTDWRNFVRNESMGIKAIPEFISPGGKVGYRFTFKLPQLPPPEKLAIDYPFIQIDNWQIRFFPVLKSRLEWFGESAVRWSRQRKTREYRRQLNEFILKLETLAQNKSPTSQNPWP
jgi:hypothetical protein